jgi:hypothetical protein
MQQPQQQMQLQMQQQQMQQPQQQMQQPQFGSLNNQNEPFTPIMQLQQEQPPQTQI